MLMLLKAKSSKPKEWTNNPKYIDDVTTNSYHVEE